MTVPANFYVIKAQRAFHACYNGDPNYVGSDNLGTKVRVTLWDLDDGYFPLSIDGVPFEYVQAIRYEEAS
jgi:hypothetical protein